MVSFVGGDFGGGNIADIASATDPVTWPTGGNAPQSGDIAVIAWAMQNTVTPTTTGWTVPTNGSADSTSGALRMRVMWRVCTGSESGTITLTNSGSVINRQCAVLAIWRGVDNTTPIDQIQFLAETTAGTTHACPSVTLGVANAAVVAVVGERVSSGTNAWTPPSGYTEREDSDGVATGSGGTSCAIADDGLATSRSSGTVVTPGAWTSGNSISTANVVTFTLSLKPSTSVVSGAATLSASGTLTAGGINHEQAAAAASGSATVTADGIVREQAAASPAATATLTADGHVVIQSATALSASGTLTADSTVRQSGQSSLTAAGAVVADGLVNVLASTSLAADGTVTVSSGQTVAGSAVLTASGALSAAGGIVTPGLATLTAAAVLAAQAQLQVSGVTAMSAASALTVSLPGGSSRGSMSFRARQSPDTHAAARTGASATGRPRAGASMGGS